MYHIGCVIPNRNQICIKSDYIILAVLIEHCVAGKYGDLLIYQKQIFLPEVHLISPIIPNLYLSSKLVIRLMIRLN